MIAILIGCGILLTLVAGFLIFGGQKEEEKPPIDDQFIGAWVSECGTYNEIYLTAEHEVILCDAELKRIGYGAWSVDEETERIQFIIDQMDRHKLMAPVIEERLYSFMDEAVLSLTREDGVVQHFTKHQEASHDIHDIFRDLEARFEKILTVQPEEKQAIQETSNKEEVRIEKEQWSVPVYTYQNHKVGSKQAMEIIKRILGVKDRVYIHDGLKVVSGTIYYSIFSMGESGHGPLTSYIDVQTGIAYNGDDKKRKLYGIYTGQNNIAKEVLEEMPMASFEQMTVEADKLRGMISIYQQLLRSIDNPFNCITKVTMPFDIKVIHQQKYTEYQLEITSKEETKTSEWVFLEDAKENIYFYKEGIPRPVLLDEVQRATELMEQGVQGEHFEHQFKDVMEYEGQCLLKVTSSGTDEEENVHTATYYVDIENEQLYLAEEPESTEHEASVDYEESTDHEASVDHEESTEHEKSVDHEEESEINLEAAIADDDADLEEEYLYCEGDEFV